MKFVCTREGYGIVFYPREIINVDFVVAVVLLILPPSSMIKSENLLCYRLGEDQY